MSTAVDIGWTPAPSSPWVEYYLGIREKGSAAWNWVWSVKHPRTWCTLPPSCYQVGHTYELMILCKTRLNIWNSETYPPPGARILEFTVTDSSPTPADPGGLSFDNWTTNGVIYVKLNPPGANTYSWTVWRSFVNDRDTATKLGNPYASQIFADSFTLGDSWSGSPGDNGKTAYYWVYPISYWGKVGLSYPRDRFNGWPCTVVATAPPPETHSR